MIVDPDFGTTSQKTLFLLFHISLIQRFIFAPYSWFYENMHIIFVFANWRGKSVLLVWFLINCKNLENCDILLFETVRTSNDSNSYKAMPMANSWLYRHTTINYTNFFKKFVVWLVLPVIALINLIISKQHYQSKR